MFNALSSPFDVQNKVVLVTGGTRGLGRAISEHLASQGACLIAGYCQNDGAALEFSTNADRMGWSCKVVKANLLTTAGIQRLYSAISEIGGIDCFIHNAAIGVHHDLQHLDLRHFLTIWNVNVGAFFALAMQLKKYMKCGSRIIAISSEGAQRAVSNYGAIGSSKAALEALCRQMAAEWAPEGILVNVVAPGLLETDTLSVLPDGQARVRNELQCSPLGRFVGLKEVAHLIHFLCSSASDGIVGQTLRIDGGKSISSLLNGEPGAHETP